MSLRSNRRSAYALTLVAAAALAMCTAPDYDASSSVEDESAGQETIDSGGPLEVVITIERGNRNVFVNGQRYGKGIHYPDIVFPNPGEPSLTIGQGANQRTVAMSGDGLQVIHIDGSAQQPPVTLVFGRYDTLPASVAEMDEVAAAEQATWECIWCGELLVCSVEPSCGGDVRPLLPPE